MLVIDDPSWPVTGAVVSGAALATSLTIAGALPVLKRYVVDAPTARSSHDRPTPRGGGIGVVAGLMAGIVVAASRGTSTPGYLILAVLVVSAVGFVDDLRSQSAVLRIVLTGACAAVFAVGLLRPHDVRDLMNVVTVVIILTGYTNAFNFMDGVNGISCFSAAIAGVWLAVLASEQGLTSAFYVAVAATSASLAFLPWNFPRATMFLGDVGSYGLGFVLAAVAVVCWHGGAPAVKCAAPFVIYLADTTITSIRRMAGGRGWSEAHREHVYQRAFDRGMSHASVTAMVGTFSAVSCLGAWVIARWEAEGAISTLLVFYAALIAAYLAMPRALGRTGEGNA
jgi:UDP-N-acetylmuramyl pentapeptide phosphotransferase/UDP-N-acetylglucosamine-1-phosphate transferase